MNTKCEFRWKRQKQYIFLFIDFIWISFTVLTNIYFIYSISLPIIVVSTCIASFNSIFILSIVKTKISSSKNCYSPWFDADNLKKRKMCHNKSNMNKKRFLKMFLVLKSVYFQRGFIPYFLLADFLVQHFVFRLLTVLRMLLRIGKNIWECFWCKFYHRVCCVK